MSASPVDRTAHAVDPRVAGRARPARRPTKRHVVLLALVPVLVVVWLPLLRGHRRAAPVPPAAPPAPATTPAAGPPAAPGVETAVALPTTGMVASAGELTRRLQALSTPFAPRWTAADGDPFAAAAPAGARTHTPDGASLARPEPATSRNPRLAPSAVLLSPTQPPMAIIGGRAYRPGDDVDGCRIVAIEERCVVFRRSGQTFSVAIPAPTLGQEQDHD